MYKKIFVITAATIAGLCLLVCITFVSALFFIESQQGSRLLQETINDRIPGSLTWETLTLSPTRGVVEITHFALVSSENQPVATFKRLFLSLDLPALLHRELVIKTFSIDAPTLTIEKDKNSTLNILAALAPPSPPSQEAVPEPATSPMALPLNVIAQSINITHGTFSFVSVPDNLDVTIEGFTLKSSGNLEKMAVDLALSTGSSTINLPHARTTIHRLNLSAAFLKDALTDLNFHLKTDAGTLALAGNAHSLFSAPEADVNMTLDGDIAQTLKAVENSSDISGRIAARATVKGPINNPHVTLFLDYPGGEVLGQKINQAHVDIAMADKKCRINQMLLNHDSGRISGQGSVDLSQAFPKGFLNPEQNMEALAWDITLDGKDIAPGTLLEPFDIKGISGICQLALTFSGGMSLSPRGTLSFKAAGAGYAPYPQADADIRLSLSQGTLSIDHCTLTSEPTRLTLLGKIALLEPGKMVPLKNPRLQLSLSSTPMALENLAPYISAVKEQGIKGTLILNATVNGSKDVPKAVVTLTGESIEVAGESVERVDVTALADREKVILDTLVLTLAENRKIEATGWADLQHHFDIKLNTDGIPLSQFNHIREQSPVDGLFSCNLSGTGTFEAPQLQGDVALRAFKVDGKPVEDFIATVDIKNQYATIKGRLNFDITAGFNLDTQEFKGNLIFKKTALTPWFQLAGQEEMSGTITGDISVNGNAHHPDDISVQSAIKTLSMVLQEKFTITATDINARLQGKQFQVPPFTTALPEQGSVTLTASGTVDGDITAKAQVHIPARAAQLFADTIPDLDGEITLDATALIKKEINDSRFNATLALIDVGLTIPDSQSKLHGINGTVRANRDHVKIESLKGFLDKGTFSITGETDLADFMPRAYTATITGNALPVTVPEGLDALFDVNATLAGTSEKSALTGTIVMDSGELTREINLNKEILSAVISPQRSRKGVNAQQEPNPYLENLTLDLFIQARNNFVIDTNLVEMEIRPDIHIQGTALVPMVSGRSTIESGTIHYFNKEFTLSQGTIDFINPYKIEPIIDIEALHEVRDWNITLSISGPTDELIFSLSSDPKLEQADITSLLLRGKTTNELISSEGGTTFSPGNALAQFAASSVQDNMRAATGLDILEVGFADPDGNGAVGNVNLTVGKKLSDRVTLKYGTASEDGQMVQTTSAEYQMTDTMTATGFQDSQGKFGGELKYRLEFR